MDTWGTFTPRGGTLSHSCTVREQAPNLNPHHIHCTQRQAPTTHWSASTQGKELSQCPGDVASGLAFSKCSTQSCQMNSQKATAQHV